MDHWQSGQSGCPRCHQPDDPRAVGDNGWEDVQYLGGFDFPPLKPGPDLPWRRSALQVRELDRAIRQWRRIDVGGGTAAIDPTLVVYVKELLLHARHLFTMMSNRANSPLLGLVYMSPHPNQLFERLRFVHHAAHFRWLMSMLFKREADHLLPHDADNGAEGISWQKAFHHVRRLRLKQGRSKDYEQDWVKGADMQALHLLLEDRHFALENEAADLEGDSQEERSRASNLRIARDVLGICASLLKLLRCVGHRRSKFSASISFHIHSHMADLGPQWPA